MMAIRRSAANATVRVILAGSALLFASCGGHPNGAIDTSLGLPTTGQLQSALIDVTDFPPGWTPAPSSADSGPNAALFCNATGPTVHTAGASVLIGDQSSGQEVSERVWAFEAGQSQIWMRAMEQSVHCTKFSMPGSTGSSSFTSYQISEASFSRLGDETFAVRLVGNQSGQDAGATLIVYVRVGDVIIQLGYYAIGEPDHATAVSLVKKAVARLKSLQT